ncbi:hypothetical protein H4S06_001480 [Coemansia sp. BCRC 34490]|nr:hypothetical protein H4S06_001480 [Coemansia sp. BCRC 34490]
MEKNTSQIEEHLRHTQDRQGAAPRGAVARHEAAEVVVVEEAVVEGELQDAPRNQPGAPRGAASPSVEEEEEVVVVAEELQDALRGVASPLEEVVAAGLQDVPHSQPDVPHDVASPLEAMEAVVVVAEEEEEAVGLQGEPRNRRDAPHDEGALHAAAAEVVVVVAAAAAAAVELQGAPHSRQGAPRGEASPLEAVVEAAAAEEVVDEQSPGREPDGPRSVPRRQLQPQQAQQMR